MDLINLFFQAPKKVALDTMATAPKRSLESDISRVKQAQPPSPYKAMRNDVETWLLQHTVGKQVYKNITERDRTFQNFQRTLDSLGKTFSKLAGKSSGVRPVPCADTVKNHFRDLAGMLKRGKRGIWPALCKSRKDEIIMFWLDCIYIHFFAHGTAIFCEQRAEGAYNSTFWDEDHNAERGELWENRASAMEEFITNASGECECWHPKYDDTSFNALFEEGLTEETIHQLPVELEYDE